MAGTLSFSLDADDSKAKKQIEAFNNFFRSSTEESVKSLVKAFDGQIKQKISIETVVDDNGLKQLVPVIKESYGEFDKLLNRQKSLAKEAKVGSLTSLRQQVNAAKQARDALAVFNLEASKTGKINIINPAVSSQFALASQKVRDLENQLRLAGAAAGTFGDRLRVAFNFDRFLSAGRKLQEVVLIFQAVGSAVSAITRPINQAATALAKLQQIGLAFESIGQGVQGSITAISESTRVALGLGVALDTVRNGFQKLSPVILNSGGTLDDVSKVLESLSSRFAAFGLNADQSNRVLNGVIQAFAKGKLQAEELTQQISEADPAFKTDFASALQAVQGELGGLIEGFDGTVASLEELVKGGQITSEVLLKVVPALSKSATLFGRLGNSATSAVDALREGGVTINQVRNLSLIHI